MTEQRDIAGWLLMYAQQFEDQHAPQNLTIGMREAADEIKRLRAEKEAAGKLSAFINLRADMFEAENAKLRAALETIAEGWEVPMEEKGWRAAVRFMEETARAALGGEND